jgi:hypothetical protein
MRIRPRIQAQKRNGRAPMEHIWSLHAPLGRPFFRYLEPERCSRPLFQTFPLRNYPLDRGWVSVIMGQSLTG